MNQDRVVFGFQESQPQPGSGSSRAVLIPGYDVMEELGRGGMGVVYKARHQTLGREVAIKLLLGSSETQRRRFVREAQALAQLRHPNLVVLYEVGECPQGPFLSMEYVEGEDLARKLVRDGPLDPRAAAELIQQVALGVGLAHSGGILHRDIKPANILIRPTGEPVLTDFGLAKLTEGESEALTRSGTLLGTPSFMPPEQISGFVDAQSDVYALGATLYALLCGEPPFGGDNLLQLAQASASTPTPALKSRGAEVPLDLETICRRCLEKEPRDRYAGALQLAHDLRRFLAGEEIEARPRTRAERARRWAERHAGLLAVVSACSAVLVVVVGLSAGALHGQRRTAVSEARSAAGTAFTTHEAEPSLANALAALQTAQRWRSLDATEPAAHATQRAALALADVAAGQGQWELAELACREAERTGVASSQVSEAREALARARGARSREQAATVERILARARAGELENDRERRWGALVELIRGADRLTVTHLTAALDRISARTREALADLIGQTIKGSSLSPDPAALQDALQALKEGRSFTREQSELYSRAGQATALRLRRESKEASRLSARRLMARALRKALPGEEAAGRLCSEALGAIGDRRAVPALVAYLRFAQDSDCAISAGLALCRIGAEEGLRAAWVATPRLGATYLKAVGERVPRALRARLSTEALRSGAHLVKRGWLKLESGDLDGALQDARAAVADRPHDELGRLLLINVLARTGALDEGLKLTARALELSPNRADLWRVRADMLRKQPGQLESALAAGKRSLELDPDSAEGHALVAATLRGLQRLKEAEASVQRGAQLHPRSVSIRYERWRLARARRDPRAEREALARLVEVDLRRSYVQRLVALCSRVRPIDHPAALRVLARAIDKYPRDAKLLRDRAGVFFLQGETERADADLRAALRETPGDAKLWHLRSKVAQKRGDPVGQVRALNKAVELSPKRADMLGERGLALARQGKHVEALADLDRAIALEAKTKVAHTNLRNRATVLINLKRYDEAVRDLSQVFAADASDHEALLARAGVHVLRKDYPAAEADLKRFLKSAPRSHPRRQEAETSLETVMRLSAKRSRP